MGAFVDLCGTSEPIVLDGGGGSELVRRGIRDSIGIWSATGVREAPEVVVEIHRDMIRAGAQIITTQTFCTTERLFTKAGIRGEARATTRRAVELAVRARAEEGRSGVLIAGSYSPLEHCYYPDLAPDEQTAYAEHLVTVRDLAEAGSDFLLAETFNTIREARAAVRAGQTTGLDVVVGLCCGRGGKLLSGETVTAAVAAIEPLGPAGFVINCTPVALTSRALADLRLATRLPIGGYGNVGETPSTWGTWAGVFGAEFIADLPPDAYLQHVATWLELGATVVGGCCGTTPAHIERIAAMLAEA